MEFLDSLPEHGNCLILNNFAGAGHVQATESLTKALELRNKTKGVALNVFSIDIHRASFGDTIGNWAIENWNAQQKREDVQALNDYLKYHWVDEWVFGAIRFFAFLYQLSKYDVDTIVTTQPLGTKALIRAVRVRNWFNRCFRPSKTQIKIHMVMTELPTARTDNFFPQVKGLCDADKAVFKLVTMKPLVKYGQSDEAFWQECTGLSLKKGEVIYDIPPVRKAFVDIAAAEVDPNEVEPGKDIPQLTVKYDTANDELDLMASATGLPLHGDKGKVTFDIQPQDKVVTLMLGGQACVGATKQYVRGLIKHLGRKDTDYDQYVYVFCGKHKKGDDTLFKQVHDIVAEARAKGKLSKNMHVVPLSYQGDTEIAPIMARSDMTITKSGGLTAMEINAIVNAKKIFLHTTCKDPKSQEDMLTRGMPLWEAGNARYLIKRKGARVVTPEIVGRHLKHCFKAAAAA